MVKIRINYNMRYLYTNLKIWKNILYILISLYKKIINFYILKLLEYDHSKFYIIYNFKNLVKVQYE